MTRSTSTLIKFTIFGLIMTMLTAFLFVVFNQTRTGPANGYSAVFTDASRLEAGSRSGPGSRSGSRSIASHTTHCGTAAGCPS